MSKRRKCKSAMKKADEGAEGAEGEHIASITGKWP